MKTYPADSESIGRIYNSKKIRDAKYSGHGDLLTPARNHYVNTFIPIGSDGNEICNGMSYQELDKKINTLAKSDSAKVLAYAGILKLHLKAAYIINAFLDDMVKYNGKES